MRYDTFRSLIRQLLRMNLVTSADVERQIKIQCINIHWGNKQKLLDDVREKVEAAQAAGGEDNNSDE